MTVVIATTDEEAPGVLRRLLEHRDVDAAEVADPGGSRRLVRVTTSDDTTAWHLAAALRDEGLVAVARPDAGPPLVVAGDAGRVTVVHACADIDRSSLPGLVELGAPGWGSGRHPTTRLMLDQLATRLRGGERVLDVGCGSGVLGLAALRLGADAVVAVDIDPSAVEATRRNATLNGFGDAVHATTARLEALEGAFDVVVANVGRAATVMLAVPLVERLAPEGWLAVGGFSPRQCELVAGFLRPLAERQRAVDGEWSVMVFSPPAATRPA